MVFVASWKLRSFDAIISCTTACQEASRSNEEATAGEFYLGRSFILLNVPIRMIQADVAEGITYAIILGETMKHHPFTILVVAFLMSILSGCATNYQDLLGQAASIESAQRTIMIGPDTKHVNVEGGEIIRFISGDKAFAWHFYVPTHISSFELNRVAPPGFLSRPVTVYLTPDPRYIGADSERN